jgi:two-component sensor histidine kinase
MSHSVAGYSTAGVCAVCSAELPDHAKLDSLPEPKLDLNRRMRAGLNAPSQARSAVAALPLRQDAREKLLLLVSELVSNAIRHAGLAAGDPIELSLTSDNGHVSISVHDGGPGFDPDADRNGADPGFGLSILSALTNEWGVENGPDGCTVWCTMPAEAIAA